MITLALHYHMEFGNIYSEIFRRRPIHKRAQCGIHINSLSYWRHLSTYDWISTASGAWRHQAINLSSNAVCWLIKILCGIHLRAISQVLVNLIRNIPGNKVHEAYMGPTWGRQDPGGPHVGPMNLAIRDVLRDCTFIITTTSPKGWNRGILMCVVRPVSSWWLPMDWRQIGTRSTSITMLIQLSLWRHINHTIQHANRHYKL